jgi:hypothetical protein
VRTVVSAAVVFAVAALACAGGATTYRVTVHFNATVTQADMDAVGEYLRGFDEDVDFLIQESFPPTGVATLSTDVGDFCAAVEEELEARTFVDEVDCGEADAARPSESPDAPTGGS